MHNILSIIVFLFLFLSIVTVVIYFCFMLAECPDENNKDYNNFIEAERNIWLKSRSTLFNSKYSK